MQVIALVCNYFWLTKIRIKKQTLHTLRDHLVFPQVWWGPCCSSILLMFCVVLCFPLSFVCLRPVSCVLNLWIVLSWLPLRFSLTFICMHSPVRLQCKTDNINDNISKAIYILNIFIHACFTKYFRNSAQTCFSNSVVEFVLSSVGTFCPLLSFPLKREKMLDSIYSSKTELYHITILFYLFKYLKSTSTRIP
jgi:hypothetical protein